jgi:hypothetical protein
MILILDMEHVNTGLKFKQFFEFARVEAIFHDLLGKMKIEKLIERAFLMIVLKDQKVVSWPQFF